MTKKPLMTNQEIERILSAAGIQPTVQRISICHFVLNLGDHPTAEQVFAWAEQNLAKISQATVYNTLGSLVQAGILKGLRFPHSEKVFYDANITEHFHFLDEKTGQLFDIDKEDVHFQVELPKKFKIRNLEVIIKGEIKI